MVFFELRNSFGTFPPDSKIKVNGPGSALFINLKTSFGKGRVYCAKSLKSEHSKEK